MGKTIHGKFSNLGNQGPRKISTKKDLRQEADSKQYVVHSKDSQKLDIRIASKQA